MTLNASGPISLAGTTAGQSISVELGENGTTQISLNDTAVRTLAGVASGAITMPTDFWGKSNVTGWYNVFGSVTTTQTCRSVGVDSSSNVYLAGSTSSQSVGSFDYLISKLDADGALQWQRTIGGSFGFEILSRMISDSSGNTYLSGRSQRDGSTIGAYIVKYDTSGALQWQNFINSNNTEFINASIDSSSNVYAFGRYGTPNSAGLNDFALVKYNSSGSLQWQQSIGGTGAENLNDGTASATGNSYIVGESNSINPSGFGKAFLVKYNTSGTLQWQRSFGTTGASTEEEFNGCAIDSSENLYACGVSQEAGNVAILVKYDSSGTLQWQKSLSIASFLKVKLNSAGTSVYVLSAALSNYFVVVKYDTSGAVQWQRSFGPFGGTPVDLAVDSAENVYVTGGQTSQYFFTVKLPANLGTYGSYTYASTAYSAATPTIPSNTTSLTSSTRSLANLDPGYLSNTTRTFSSTTTDL
jgi:hypothetical protein